MNARIRYFNDTVTDGDGNVRTFQFSKLPALTGIILGKLLLARILPLARNLLPSKSLANKKELKNAVKQLDSSVLDRISLDQVSEVLNGMSDSDLERVTHICLTNVSEMLAAPQPCAVMDENGHYQIEDVEYDPALFLELIWKELKFGLSDFFKGDRWASLLPDEDETAEDSYPPSPAQTSMSMPLSL